MRLSVCLFTRRGSSGSSTTVPCVKQGPSGARLTWEGICRWVTYHYYLPRPVCVCLCVCVCLSVHRERKLGIKHYCSLCTAGPFWSKPDLGGHMSVSLSVCLSFCTVCLSVLSAQRVRSGARLTSEAICLWATFLVTLNLKKRLFMLHLLFHSAEKILNMTLL